MILNKSSASWMHKAAGVIHVRVFSYVSRRWRSRRRLRPGSSQAPSAEQVAAEAGGPQGVVCGLAIIRLGVALEAGAGAVFGRVANCLQGNSVRAESGTGVQRTSCSPMDGWNCSSYAPAMCPCRTLHMPSMQCPAVWSSDVHLSALLSASQCPVSALHAMHTPPQLPPELQLACRHKTKHVGVKLCS